MERNNSRRKDPKLVLFVWDDVDESGANNLKRLLHDASNRILRAEIVAVVSNCEKGTVHVLANQHGIPFVQFGHPWTAQRYQLIAQALNTDYYVFSGWLQPIYGANRRTRFNPKTIVCVHPGKTPAFGSLQYCGIKLHEAVINAYKHAEVKTSSVTVHFLSHKNGYGPVVFEAVVGIDPNDTPLMLAQRMDSVTRKFQSCIIDRVVNGQIRWNGVDPMSLTSPNWHLLSQCVDIPTSKELL